MSIANESRVVVILLLIIVLYSPLMVIFLSTVLFLITAWFAYNSIVFDEVPVRFVTLLFSIV